MCGGIKLSALAEKERRLNVGQSYRWLTDLGNIEARYGGSVRSETIESKWRPYIVGDVTLICDSYYERNTVQHKYNELKEFPVPEGKGIKAVITQGNVIRILTQPAVDDVIKVHNRMPILEDV